MVGKIVCPDCKIIINVGRRPSSPVDTGSSVRSVQELEAGTMLGPQSIGVVRAPAVPSPLCRGRIFRVKDVPAGPKDRLVKERISQSVPRGAYHQNL